MPSQPQIIRTGDDKIDRSMQALASAVKELGQPVIDNGNLIKGIDVSSTSTTHVAHKLGRAWQGWFIADQTAGIMVWRDASADTSPAKTLPLTASANGTINVWIW